MIDVEEWTEIRRLHFSEGVPIKELVRRTGRSRNTVRDALRSDRPPRYQRAKRGSIVDAVEPEIRRLLTVDARMPATVIAERIGWDRSMTVLKDRVRELRPLFLPVDPAGRTVYEPGELAQWDLWFPPVEIPLGFGQVGSPPVLVGVAGYSRMATAQMIPSRETWDILGGHLECLSRWGRVPRSGVYDQEPAIGRWRGRTMVFTEGFNAFRGTLAMGAVLCQRSDPEAKGLVERFNGYLETSFLPGRSFDGPADFNAQLAVWLDTRANVRHHRRIGCRPVDRWPADAEAMRPLPPIAPEVTARRSDRLGRDHYIRAATNDYSVHPAAIGRRIDISVALDQVIVTCAGQIVADHPRCWASHQTITDPAHKNAADRLRGRYRSAIARGSSNVIDIDVEERDLATYDRLNNGEAS